MRLIPPAGLVATSFRTLPRFNLVRAGSTAEAVAAIDGAKDPAVLAGGTDLPARFNEGFTPSDLIDISRIDALRQIRLAGDSLEIGATVSHASGSAHPLIARHLPSFGAAWSRIANVRIRFSATIGGNLMARRTRYEGAILLSALGARLRFESKADVREIAVEDIWSGNPERGLLTTIVVPLRKGLRLDYARDLRPIMTQAVALEDHAPGRVVTATEFIVPRIRVLKGDMLDGAFDASGDPVTSTSYIRKVSETLLGRQLERMRA